MYSDASYHEICLHAFAIFSCVLVYFFAGPAMFDKILQGRGLIVILVLLLAVVLAPWYATNFRRSHSEKKPNLPDLPTAFTGRSDEVHRLVHYLVTEHVSVVAVTGGPGYGKSSVAIVGSHELVQLGIPVYYVSLSAVDSIQTFIMAFMHVVGGKKNQQMPEISELISWISSLQTKTVVILDNADLLTLKQTELRNDFLRLLKDAIARSAYFHLVAATRYRFKFANDFEEIHLDPLSSTEALTLLRRVVLASGQTRDKKDFSSLKDEHLSVIASKTGGIPLALKVVGILLKSGIVSTTEVLDELAVDPLHALSRECFTPDEQLNRCFNLSYKYLSKTMRKCLIIASRFPGTFDRRARDAVIANMTGDAHCLDQLVYRSLVEYSTAQERYTMHSLLRTFVSNSVMEWVPRNRYFRLFCNHFILLLSTRITEARTGGDVNHLYATITADYHNFLHLLHIYTNVSKNHPNVPHREMLLFANQAFDVMKSRFPWEPLVEWWTVVLNNVCRMVHSPAFRYLVPHYLQLSTKFGNLLRYHKQYQLAGDILLFADQCVRKDNTLAIYFTNCWHSQADSYTGMLQALMRVYEEDGLDHRALEVRKRLHYCIDSSPDKKPEDLIVPDSFCTDGIGYLQEKHSQSKDFHSALQLFDAHYRCFDQLEERADKLIKMLEDANDFLTNQFERSLSIAKRCNMVRNYRKESVWLMEALKFEELPSLPLDNFIEIFSIHFRLTYLHWRIFDDAEKAIEHSRAAYSLAIKSHCHTVIWKASIRLGDILHQIGGSQSEAGFYFEEALKFSPFINANQDFIYEYQYFAELHLIAIHFHTGEHGRCIRHYGQWVNLEAASALDHARKIIDALSEPVTALNEDVYSLAVIDSSLDWFLDDITIAKKFLHAFIQKTSDSTRYYIRVLHFIICSVVIVLSTVFIAFVVGIRVSLLSLLHTPTFYCIYLPHYSFHCFLFYTLTEHKLWVPRKLPWFPLPIAWFYACTFILSTILGVLVFSVSSMFGVYLLLAQVVFVYSPSSLYHNMSMKIIDISVYDTYP